MTMPSIEDGFQDLSDFFGTLPQDIEDCYNISGDLLVLRDWLMQFHDPIGYLVQQALANLANQWPDFQSIILDLISEVVNRDFFEIGEDLAHITFILFGKIQA